MSGAILLPQAVLLAALTITIFVLVVAFYFDEPHSRPEDDNRWRRRY